MTTTKKTQNLTTELFAGKVVPDFIKAHAVFKKPVNVQKVFSSIGMPNYREKANLDKCLMDIKKEGTYVWNMLKIMHDILGRCKTDIADKADKFQYLLTRDEREKQRGSMNELYSLCSLVNEFMTCIDPHSKEVMDEAIKTEDSKISLRVMKDISNTNGKIAFRKGEALFRAFGKIGEKCGTLGVPFTALDTTDQFKVFSKENIPNKEFAIVFSAGGQEGAWDILTMSMRAQWHSCQRWEGEYPRCLIGSILSKFVGVMYLTSGVMNDATEKNGNRANLGTKMMRRSVVRYAIDADDNKPCIVIDKMYPDLDKDILKAFMESIKARTKLAVYYAPDAANANIMRHVYMPSEQIREEVMEREWSYQDTPIKSKTDLYALLLNFNRDEVERELKGFRVNLSLFMARKFEDIYSGGVSIDSEVKKTINNIRMNTSFTPFCDNAVSYIIAAFTAPQSVDFLHSRIYYRKYLMDFLLNRKKTIGACTDSVNTLIAQNSSRAHAGNALVEYIFSIAIEFTKSEIKRCIN